MKWNFLYQITAASRTPDSDPVLSVLCPQLNLLNPFWTKFLGTPLSSTTLRKIKPMSVRCSDLRGYSFNAVSLCPWVAGALQFLNLCGDQGTIKWTIFLSTSSCLWACNTSLIRMLRNVSLFNISSHIKGMLVFSSLQTRLFTKHTVKHEWTVLLGNPLPPHTHTGTVTALS